jgi:hypothetical protein
MKTFTIFLNEEQFEVKGTLQTLNDGSGQSIITEGADNTIIATIPAKALVIELKTKK